MTARFLPLLLSCCLLLLLVPTTATAHGEIEGILAEPLVRIGLSEKTSEATIGVVAGAGKLIDLGNRKDIQRVGAGESLTIRPAGNQVSINKKRKADAVRIVADEATGRVTFKGRSYRGSIDVHPWQGQLVVVNRCTLDEYLYGVVPQEMPSGWHEEALKAQSVAARTYAVRSMGQYEHGLFDVRPNVWDQVYGGSAAEHPKTNRAIDATSGLILTYQGEPIIAYFHSSSGLSTINGSAMKGSGTAHPYLRGVPSRETEMKDWSLESSVGDFAKKLKARGYSIGKIHSVMSDPNDSGLIQVLHDGGVLELPRNTVRGLYGGETFRSCNFEPELNPPARDPNKALPESGKLKFVGMGWGHGVGMSQYGAKGFAEEGWTYSQILAHFYQGTEMSLWYDISGDSEDDDDFFGLEH